MKYLLDTNVIVEHLRGKREIDVLLIKKGSAISVISQAELYYGVHKSKKLTQNLRKIKQMLEDLRIDIIHFNEDILNVYGRIKVNLETKGHRLDEFDLLIAATALSTNLTLVTKNKKHFQRIPQLKLLS